MKKKNTENTTQQNKKPMDKYKKAAIIIPIFAVIATAALAVLAFVFVPKLAGRFVPANNDDIAITDSSANDSKDISDTNSTEESGTSDISDEKNASEEPIPESLERDMPEDCIVTSVVAENGSNGYIDPDTDFIIKSNKDIEANELKSMLALSTDKLFSIEKTGTRTYKLTSDKTMPQDSIVTLELKDENGSSVYSWAFQTSGDFRIKSVLPADGTEYVEPATGIEIEFTSFPDVANAKNYFEITPAVNGKFLQNKNYLIFAPDDHLKLSTAYTVKLKKGLPSLNGETLSEDMEFSFKTSDTLYSSSGYCYAPYGVSETFLTSDTKLITIFCSDNIKDSNYKVELYRYTDDEKYYSTLKEIAESDSAKYDFDLSNYTDIIDKSSLELVYSETMKLQYEGSYGYTYIILPDDLEEGRYYAEITCEDRDNILISRMIQVSDISVYAHVTQTDAVYFVNDASTGKPASGASVVFSCGSNDYKSTISKDGTAYREIHADKSKAGILKIEYNGHTYIDFLNYLADEDPPLSEKYYSYIYSDRTRYLSTDTIYVWGVVKPRMTKYALPSKLSVILHSYDFDETGLIEVPVKLAKDGTFTAEISYKDHETSFMYLSLVTEDIVPSLGVKYSDENTISRTNINIKDYVKPTYFYDPVIPEYLLYPQENNVNITMNATFTDGTPAENLNIKVSSSDMRTGSVNIVTDENGHAETLCLLNDQDTWLPQYTEFAFTLQGEAENEYSTSYAGAYAFYRDTMLMTDFEKKDSSGTLDLKTSKIVPEKILDTQLQYYYSNNNTELEKLQGAPTNTEVTITLSRSWHEKKEAGSYYDFIEKVTKKKYTYEYHNETLGTYTANTVNGIGSIELPLDHKNSNYYVNIKYKDSKNNPVTIQDHYICSTYEHSYANDPYKQYSFMITDTNGDELPGDDDDYYLSTFKEDQTLNFSLMENYNIKVTNTNGRIFYLTYTDSLKHMATSDSMTFKHKMTNEYVPNVYMSAAYFDGKHIFKVNSTHLVFDPDEREYTVTATAANDKYRPGDTASVTVSVKDKNGKPASGASVSLSVVDEAALSISDNPADPLTKLYKCAYYPNYIEHCSYIEHKPDYSSMSEKGGGGYDISYTRKDFKDTSAFLTATTNANGTATFTFEVPDNITEWRCTAQAVGTDADGLLMAGAGKSPLIVTQPFFLTTTVLREYTDGDDICVAAKAHGGDNDASTKITAKVTGTNFEKTLTSVSGKTINFGKLPIGEYKVLFSAKNGTCSDAVELSFEVVKTSVEMNIVNLYDLSSEKLEINPTRWPVRLAFIDKNYIFCTSILQNLIRSYSARSDLQLAYDYALLQYGFITKDEYLAAHGGIGEQYFEKLLPYSERDAELTALMITADPELADENAAALFRREIAVTEYSGTAAACYLGLASMGEPVLNDIKYILENESLDPMEQLYLSSALAVLGDHTSAKEYYLAATEDIYIYNNELGEKEAYIGSKNVTRTRAALIAASCLHLPEAEYFARYLMNNATKDAVALELMIYMQNYEPEVTGDAVISYKLNGETITETLDKFSYRSITFTEENYKAADIKAVSGEVLCLTFYKGMITENKTESTITLRKSLSPVDGKWEPGALVRVTVTASNMPNDFMMIEDVIPSCGRYTYTGSNNNCNSISNGQHMKFYLYHNKRSLVYYFRISTAGEVVADSAVAYDNFGNWGISERTVINVEDK